MKLSIESCAAALNHAAMNRRAAIQLELAVGLAVFQYQGSSSKDARAMLNDAYAAAGYRCVHISEMDYKTVNRRINATAALFEKLPVAKWVGRHSDADAIKSICDGLEPYELFTIADVMRYCTPQKVAKQRAAKVQVTPNADILNVPSGQAKVHEQFRRAADQADSNVLRVNTAHLSLVIPKGTPREEIIDLAMKLLQMAKESNKELLTV